MTIFSNLDYLDYAAYQPVTINQKPINQEVLVSLLASYGIYKAGSHHSLELEEPQVAIGLRDALQEISNIAIRFQICMRKRIRKFSVQSDQAAAVFVKDRSQKGHMAVGFHLQ